MFKVNNISLLADELEILETLKAHLEINGTFLFNEIKPGVNNIQFNCPIHKDGQERKPSCGIRTTDTSTIKAGTVHCLTCGYTATLQQMISDCFGKKDDGYYGREWLIKNFASMSVGSRETLKLDVSRGKNEIKVAPTYIQESELATYRYYHDYMYKRRLTNDVIELFDIGYDDNFTLRNKLGEITNIVKCLTFPVHDKLGNVLFIARRSVDIKFFHYPTEVTKPVYGLFQLPDGISELIVCESILNALTCWSYGRPAVALLGLGTEYQYKQLEQLKVRKLISGLDPDSAGRRATEKLKKYFSRKKLVTSFVISEGRDINDLEKWEFDALEETF